MIVGMVSPAGALPELVAGSVVTCHGWVADWAPRPGDDIDWLALLGCDAPRYLGMPRGDGQLRFAAARRLLKHVCAARLGVEPASIELGYEPYGRPYLVGAGMPHVSISHTRDLVAVAVSDVGPVGVDVEHRDRPLLDDDLLARACTPQERAELRDVPADRRNRHAVQLWTLKESYAKALGRGLGIDFREVGFSLLRTRRGFAAQPRTQVVRESRADAADWRFQLAAVPGGYASACAIRLPIPPVPTTPNRTTPNRTTVNRTRSTT